MQGIFIAATHQNVGKTMLSLGLMGTLISRGVKTGYMKPVGQRTVSAEGLLVDEDALLMERVFNTGADLQAMNPVTVGKGFTAAWIRQGKSDVLETKIREAYAKIAADKDFVVIEGTGHAGVGSVLDLSNARVAKLLGADVVMVAPGGVGRPIDEVALNRELLDREGVRLAGVVINKVQPKKYDQVRELVSLGFERRGIRVLGVLPYDDVLPVPTMQTIMEEVGGELISRQVEDANLNVLVRHYLVGAMSTHQAMDYFQPGSLVITPSDREDMILAAIGMSMADRYRQRENVAGLILTGKSQPHPAILELIQRSRVPTLAVRDDTYTVASQIHDLMAKIRYTDKSKIEHATRLVSQFVNLSEVCRGC